MSDLLAHLFRQLTLHLDFIYIGKVNVLEDDLYAFLSVAGDLKIEGLTSNSSPQVSQVRFFVHTRGVDTWSTAYLHSYPGLRVRGPPEVQ